MQQIAPDHRGTRFLSVTDFTLFATSAGDAVGEKQLTSPIWNTEVSANEIVVSWNVEAQEGAGIRIEARAYHEGAYTKYYTLGQWSREGTTYPRQSVNGQKDADGDVHTDTLALNRPAERVQVRITLHPATSGVLPKLKYLGICLTDTTAHPPALEPNRAVWGHEIVVPSRTQLGYPGGEGWCSPTSTSMVLAFWAKKLERQELDMPVPDVAHAIYDKVYDGTGNWPFNTAFAGSFPGIRAYVTRLSDIRELEDWVAIGMPPVVSVSYDLLKGKPKDEDPGHLMVCDGFTAEGDIVLNDPAHHPERGEMARRVFTRANFLRAWLRSKNLVYLIYPEGARRPVDNFGHWE